MRTSAAGELEGWPDSNSHQIFLAVLEGQLLSGKLWNEGIVGVRLTRHII